VEISEWNAAVNDQVKKSHLSLSICLSDIYQSACLSSFRVVCLFIHPSIHPFINISICLSIHPSIGLCIHLAINQSIHQSINQSINPSIHLCPFKSIYKLVFPSIYPSVYPYVYCLLLYTSICLSIYLSTHLSIYLSVCISCPTIFPLEKKTTLPPEDLEHRESKDAHGVFRIKPKRVLERFINCQHFQRISLYNVQHFLSLTGTKSH